jgi:hypothetical protein
MLIFVPLGYYFILQKYQVLPGSLAYYLLLRLFLSVFYPHRPCLVIGIVDIYFGGFNFLFASLLTIELFLYGLVYVPPEPRTSLFGLPISFSTVRNSILFFASLVSSLQVQIGLTQLMCLYGYSMLSFVPGVILCAVPPSLSLPSSSNFYISSDPFLNPPISLPPLLDISSPRHSHHFATLDELPILYYTLSSFSPRKTNT